MLCGPAQESRTPEPTQLRANAAKDVFPRLE